MGPHHHDHDHDAGTPGFRRLTLALLIPAVLITALGMLLLWPGDRPAVQGGETPPAVPGTITAITAAECPPVPEGDPEYEPGACGTVTVRLADGTRIETGVPTGPGAVEVAVGDDVKMLVLEPLDEGGEPEYAIADHQRSTGLWLVLAAFAVAVIAFGRWRGLAALGGLVVTFLVLLYFVVPAILDGGSPVLVAVVGSAAIMLTVLYLTHGFRPSTTVAVAGTLVSLAITAVLSALATGLVHLTGVADETANFLTITEGEVNMRGLLLAGIVIGSLGVLDDVTVTQSVTVTELAVANPGYGFRRLYAAATRVGRAHIASVINTIVLAYAGASLPLMLLFAAGNTPVSELLTGELIAQEIVRSAVGTIGLITAVPVTTALAAWMASRAKSEKSPHRVRRTAAPAAAPPSAAPTPQPASPGWARAAHRVALVSRTPAADRVATARRGVPRIHAVIVARPPRTHGRPSPTTTAPDRRSGGTPEAGSEATNLFLDASDDDPLSRNIGIFPAGECALPRA